MNKNYRKLGVILLILSLLMMPLFTYLFIISLHSTRLISDSLSSVVLALAIFSVFLFIYSLITIFTSPREKKMKLIPKILLIVFFTGYIGISSSVMVLLYGPYTGFKDWLVTTAMTTLSHKYFAEWFYDDFAIEEVMENNEVVEAGDDSNPDLVVISSANTSEQTIYANEYEEAVLKRDEGNNLYKIIDIKEKRYKGKLAVIYDPSKVHIGVSKYMGSDVDTAKGQYIYDIEKNYNAVLSMNASGFYDPGYNSHGGVPRGAVFSFGSLKINNSGYKFSTGGMIGFDQNNKMILSKTMTVEQAKAKGIRDGIQYGPFLIVNGKSSFVKGNGGWGTAPRSAIAQRKDGIVLFLVIDGRQAASVGADMNDLVTILKRYGAYNAANLDGGTSSAMSVNGKIITNPRNGSYKAKTRWVPDAWIVTK